MIFCFQTNQSQLDHLSKILWEGEYLFSNDVFYHNPLKASPRYFFMFLHNFQHLFSCSKRFQPLDKALAISVALIQTLLLSTSYLHPATSWLTNPSRTGIFPNDPVSWEVFPLQQSACIVKNYPCYLRISVCLHIQNQLLITRPNFTYLTCINKLLELIIQYLKM